MVLIVKIKSKNVWLSKKLSQALPALRHTGGTAMSSRLTPAIYLVSGQLQQHSKNLRQKRVGVGLVLDTGYVSRLLVLKPQLCTYWLKHLRQDSTSFFSSIKWEYIVPMSQGCCKNLVTNTSKALRKLPDT